MTGIERRAGCWALWAGLLTLAACDDGDDGRADPPPAVDGAIADAVTQDAAVLDLGVPDAALDATVDAAPQPPDAAPVCGAACATVAWRGGPALPRATDHHTTFVHGAPGAAAMFVVGGITSDARGGASTVYDTIERATVRDDALLAAFETAPVRLPFPLGFHGQARVGERYFLTGGVTVRAGQPTGSDRVVLLRMAPGPSVAEAVDCGPMAYGVVHPTAAIVGDWLYVVGGSSGPPVERTQFARIDGEGCPTDWAEGPDLPAPRSHHAAAVFDGQLYLIGGFGADQTPRPTILRSMVGGDGQVTGWTPAGTIEPTPWTSSAIVADGTVWLLGGGVGQGFIDAVQRAPFDADGIGPFEPVERPLPFARAHVHQTPLFDGHLYSAGGRVFDDAGRLGSTERTVIGRLSPAR